MNIRNLENGLALLGAAIVLAGVTFAASSALAEELPTEPTVTAADKSSNEASKANRKAAEDAVDSIAEDNKLDLEIHLLDRTSTIVARAR